MKFLLSVSLLMTVLRAVEAINCHVGRDSATTSTAGCMSCQTVGIFQSSGTVMNTKSCLTGNCAVTDNVVNGNGVKVFCCSTDNCNSAAVDVNTVVSAVTLPGTNVGVGGTNSGGLRCYSSNMTIVTGCNYCMKSTTSLGSNSVTRSCATVCVSINAGVFKTNCCQTDLCNDAPKTFSPAFMTYFSVLVVAATMYMTVA